MKEGQCGLSSVAGASGCLRCSGGCSEARWSLAQNSQPPQYICLEIASHSKLGSLISLCKGRGVPAQGSDAAQELKEWLEQAQQEEF